MSENTMREFLKWVESRTEPFTYADVWQASIAHQNQDAVPIYQALSTTGWVDIDKEYYDIVAEDNKRIVYLSPPHSQEVADALEAAAKVAEHYSLAEKIARLTMSNPVTHSINVTKIIANEIRALIK